MPNTFPASIIGSSQSQLAHLIQAYLEHLRLCLYSPCTIYTRQRQLERFRLFCLNRGVANGEEIAIHHVTDYQRELCRYRKADGTPLAGGNIIHLLCALNALFKWEVRNGMLRVNPAANLELPRKEHCLPRAVLSSAEIERLLYVPNVDTPAGLRDRAVLEFLYSTGIRRMELCRLNLRHLDLTQQLVRVERGKGNKDRLVPIGERAVKWLANYLQTSRPCLKPAEGESAVFLNAFGQRMSEQVLGRLVRRIFQKAGLLGRGGCHSFRHAFATGLLSHGCGLRHIQEMLGHASLATTQLYTHLNIGQLKQAHRRFHPANQDTTNPNEDVNTPSGFCARDRVDNAREPGAGAGKNAYGCSTSENGILTPDPRNERTALGVLAREASALRCEHLLQVLGYVCLLRQQERPQASAGGSGRASVSLAG